MQKCKSFLSLCLLIVLLAACNGKKTASISDFSNQLYTPNMPPASVSRVRTDMKAPSLLSPIRGRVRTA